MTTQQLAFAQAFAAAGCCVIPTRPDGTKAPAVDWKAYQRQHPTVDQLNAWFRDGGYPGLGVVCGTVSGHLEMLELEGRAAHLGEQLATALADHDAADLWARLCGGYLERTPSGGFHWLYRVAGADPRRNTKLARRPSTPDELEAWKQREHAKADETIAAGPARDARHQRIDTTTAVDVPQVLIETRGEGGYVVTAPSNGTTHPSGQAWTLLAGGPAQIPTITAAERDLLFGVCALFDQMPTTAAPPTSTPAGTSYAGEARPGDDFNQRATWEEILEPHGWTRARRLGRGWAWVRPGKHTRDGFSATTGQANDADRLYVFSSSTTFGTERPYSKFAAYAHLEHGDDLATAASALRQKGYGAPLEEPRTLTFTGPPPNTEETPGPPAPPAVTVATPGPSSYSLTDDGNALRLVDRHHAEIRYVPQRGLWLRWTGHVWAWDEAETIRELARGVARDLPDDNDQRRKHRTKSLSNGAIYAQVRLAQTDPRIVTHIAALDSHPYQLNTPGGVVDLTTGHITPSNSTQLHTRCTTVAPDFTLPAPRWERFLADTFAGDPELTTYVQRLLGISLIGEVLEQVLPFAYGSGANGKTTMLGAIQRIIGFGETGYAISAPAEILLATRNQDHPASIAQLSGARLVVTSELEDGQQFAEARVKQLTGRDAINARFMRQNPFTFIPSHTLWVLANHRPNVKAGGPAFWRRMAMLPFLHTVPVADRDPHLEDRLVNDEGPAILAWCIRGAADYLNHGLAVPASVAEATQAYERDQDTITRFIDDMCETGAHTLPHMRTKVASLRSEYEAWCHVEGETPLNAKAFTQALRTQHGVYSERDSTARWYAGIRIKDDVTPTADPAPWEPRWDQR